MYFSTEKFINGVWYMCHYFKKFLFGFRFLLSYSILFSSYWENNRNNDNISIIIIVDTLNVYYMVGTMLSPFHGLL